MSLFKKISPLEKEYQKLIKEEQKYILKNQEEKENFLNKALADKVPPKLQSTLEAAFIKAFKLIFSRGKSAIELTYNKEKLENEFKLRDFSGEVKKDRKSLKEFSKKARNQDSLNLFMSGVSGVGMGILGIGIPDIPVFTGMILRDIYETSINFGFLYDSEKERFFILNIIKGAISCGDELCKIDLCLNKFIETETLSDDYNEEKEIESTAALLSDALLYMKFLQGIPIAGAVGGFYDIIYMKHIAKYSSLKYKKRYLTRKMVKG